MSERIYATERLSEHISRTPEGFLLCEAVPINRTGEQVYSQREADLMPWLTRVKADENGFIRVLREPEEVFREETLRSFEGKPFTVDHPEDLVSPETWSEYAEGHLQNIRRGSGDQADLTLADILVTTDKAIGLILSGLREVSCGYDADYEQVSPGVLRQVNILGNHLALVDKGRAGERCTIQDSFTRGRRATAKDFGRPVDVATINKRNAEFWESKSNAVLDAPARRTNSGATSGRVTAKDFGAPVDVAAINKRNSDFWKHNS